MTRGSRTRTRGLPSLR